MTLQELQDAITALASERDTAISERDDARIALSAASTAAGDAHALLGQRDAQVGELIQRLSMEGVAALTAERDAALAKVAAILAILNPPA